MVDHDCGARVGVVFGIFHGGIAVLVFLLLKGVALMLLAVNRRLHDGSYNALVTDNEAFLWTCLSFLPHYTITAGDFGEIILGFHFAVLDGIVEQHYLEVVLALRILADYVRERPLLIVSHTLERYVGTTVLYDLSKSFFHIYIEFS